MLAMGILEGTQRHLADLTPSPQTRATNMAAGFDGKEDQQSAALDLYERTRVKKRLLVKLLVLLLCSYKIAIIILPVQYTANTGC